MRVSPARPVRVALVGFEDQDNLGLRYLSSRLRLEGHRTCIVKVSEGPGPVLDAIQELDPDVAGFSLIFQYLVPQFAELLTSLRAEGVSAHFTMGGHYASFESEALLAAIPELDSVVRFEGEDTLLELAERIAYGTEWKDVQGIAFRNGGGVTVAPARHGREDLDELPWPDRDDIDYHQQSLPMASIIGGRGCPYRCSFCSIITFYEGNLTRGRRRRDPKLVVDEIEYLRRERGVHILLWQDDDFLASGSRGIEWAHAIGRECIKRGLHHDLRWKISCRSDEVRLDTLQPLVEAGLSHVYLGVESGDPDNLKNMNKLETAEDHLQAGEVLRQLGLSFDFGFMLLEPWSTFGTLRNNIAFLRQFAGDGAAVIGFVRMLPYVGTAVHQRLIDEGRLSAHDIDADYDFLDPRLDAFYDWMLTTFHERNHSPSGTFLLLRLLLFETHLDMPDQPVDAYLRDHVRGLTAVSNRITLDTLESAAEYLESLEVAPEDDPVLESLRQHAVAQDHQLRRDLMAFLSAYPGAMERVHLGGGSSSK
jgi:radical SAM superfamily enzyme YgiQ (UPF0313 family)